MTDRPARLWQDMTTTEMAAFDMAKAIAILPVAAIEQHGPHLPLATDARICAALLNRALALAPDDLPVTVLPMQAVGVSPEHGDFPGTLSTSHETMIGLLLDVGKGVAAAGVRKLVLLNSHGGQPQVLDIAAQKLRRKHRMLVFPLNGYRYWGAEDVFPPEEIAHGIHGGAIETSLMLHIDPGAVRKDAIKNFESLSRSMERDYHHLRPFGRTASFGWQTQDLNPEGACGDATLASAAHGKKLLETGAKKLAQILTEIDRLPPDVLKVKDV